VQLLGCWEIPSQQHASRDLPLWLLVNYFGNSTKTRGRSTVSGHEMP
jgi:hypothetical protein